MSKKEIIRTYVPILLIIVIGIFLYDYLEQVLSAKMYLLSVLLLFVLALVLVGIDKMKHRTSEIIGDT